MKRRTPPRQPQPQANARPTGGHVFVDESKAKDYLLVAAVVLPHELGEARQAVRGLLLPGQGRLHMKNERDSRRKQILSTFSELAPAVTIYRAGTAYRTELERRNRCLDALVRDAARDRQFLLVLELDETLVSRDKQQLITATRTEGCSETLSYRHERAVTEPLLALPDAIAWAWARGGEWRRRCESVVVAIVDA